MRFYGRVAFDSEFSGMIVDQAEADRLCDKLTDKQILIMGNHGVTVVAPTVALAFDEIYHYAFVRSTLWTAKWIVSKISDNIIIEGIVNGSAWLVSIGGKGLRYLHTGIINYYNTFILIGLIIYLLIYLCLK
jgi:NADH:ubiquinone oxidoreductase subunit 5 (subunit L)/multisubunit Na+/H+ antiporter MnhA subunit